MEGTDTRKRRVAREDLVLFINACFACTRQNEFYSDAFGQAVSIGFLHEYILGNYRRLYARTLACGINHFNAGQVLFHLLRTGKQTPESFRAEENRLIHHALRGLPPQRSLRVFKRLREERVNNRRTRAVIRDYLRDRPDPVFDAVKYRTKVAAAAAHAHLALPDEFSQFLYALKKAKSFETPLFESVRAAHYSKQKVYDLPYTVAEGLAAKHGIPRDVFLKQIEPRLTQGERLRLQGAADRAKGVSFDIDLGRVPLTKLALFVLGLSPAQQQAKAAQIEEALSVSAARALRRAPAKLGKVAAVLDASYSTIGSRQKRRRPLGVALAASTLLRRAASEYRAFWTPAPTDTAVPEYGITAGGQTALAAPVIDALEWGADLVVIVSDGYENDPPGAVAAIVEAFRSNLDRERRVSVIHANPVFDSENFEPRTLGKAIPTVGLRDAEDLPTMLGFARFVDGSADLPELEAYLEHRVQDALAQGGADAAEAGA